MLHRVISSCVVPALVGAILVPLFFSCVELPNDGQPAPDYRSLIRYVHAGRGVDTIALLASAAKFTRSSTSTAQVGTDTIRTTRDSTLLYNTYRRVRVDLSATFEVFTDDQSIGTLSRGNATPYLDTPSGSRKLKVRASGDLVDSVAVRDTLIEIRIDTIKPGGITRTARSFVEKKNNFRFPLSGSVTEVIDTAVSPIVITTQHKGTLFFIGDIAARDTSRGGLIRYGWVRYVYAPDRRTFDPPGLADTALVRFCNASANIGNISVSGYGTSIDTAGVPFGRSTGYVRFLAKQDTTYTLFFRRANVTVDSLRLRVSQRMRYTALLLDSATAVAKKVYADE